MRRDAMEPASGWTRRRAAGLMAARGGTRSFAPRWIPVIVAAALLACASPASAAYIHDTASESFGKDGTSATTIGSTENQRDAVIAGLSQCSQLMSP